jgi:hypothetical protein
MLKNLVLRPVFTTRRCRSGPVNREEPRQSMMFSCETSPFLRVSVSTPRRGGLSPVQIKLTDPLSREQGVNPKRKRMPRSHYEDVVVAPKAPGLSREHSVEVCSAAPGEYILTVYEHGDGLCRVTLDVDNESLPLHLQSREGRIRQYRFLFTVKKEEVDLTWLDKDGRPQIALGDNVLVGNEVFWGRSRSGHGQLQHSAGRSTL